MGPKHRNPKSINSPKIFISFGRLLMSRMTWRIFAFFLKTKFSSREVLGSKLLANSEDS